MLWVPWEEDLGREDLASYSFLNIYPYDACDVNGGAESGRPPPPRLLQVGIRLLTCRARGFSRSFSNDGCDNPSFKAQAGAKAGM